MYLRSKPPVNNSTSNKNPGRKPFSAPPPGYRGQVARFLRESQAGEKQEGVPATPSGLPLAQAEAARCGARAAGVPPSGRKDDRAGPPRRSWRGDGPGMIIGGDLRPWLVQLSDGRPRGGVRGCQYVRLVSAVRVGRELPLIILRKHRGAC